MVVLWDPTSAKSSQSSSPAGPSQIQVMSAQSSMPTKRSSPAWGAWIPGRRIQVMATVGVPSFLETSTLASVEVLLSSET